MPNLEQAYTDFYNCSNFNEQKSVQKIIDNILLARCLLVVVSTSFILLTIMLW